MLDPTDAVASMVVDTVDVELAELTRDSEGSALLEKIAVDVGLSELDPLVVRDAVCDAVGDTEGVFDVVPHAVLDCVEGADAEDVALDDEVDVRDETADLVADAEAVDVLVAVGDAVDDNDPVEDAVADDDDV